MNKLASERYISNEGDEFNIFNGKIFINRTTKIEKPPLLNKYYSIEQSYNIDALVNNYLYASHPKQLNDPFDCYPYFYKNTNDNNRKLYRLTKKLASYFKAEAFVPESFIYKGFCEILDLFIYQNLGIVSMTNVKNNAAKQWDHYTNHKGFSVTFDTNRLLKSTSGLQGPFKISYPVKLSQMDVDEKNFRAQTVYKSLIKEKSWISEDEWRFFVFGNLFNPIEQPNKANYARRFHYSFSSIVRVTLGFYFFDSNSIEEVSTDHYRINFKKDKNSHNIIKNKLNLLDYCSSNNIKISIIELNENDFAFEPRNIEYMLEGEIFEYKIE